MAKQKFEFQKGILNNPGTTDSTSTELSSVEQTPAVETMVKKLDSEIIRPLFNIKMIPKHLIRSNEKNKNYTISNIDSLKESILQFGLHQNLLVIYSMEEDIFILEAGHRRKEALDQLIQEYSLYEDITDPKYQLYVKNVKEYEKGYPCKVSDNLKDNVIYDTDSESLDDVPEAVIDSEIRLQITNLETRDLSESPSLKAANVARLAKLYERKNVGKPKSELININKKIAEDLNISEKHVISLKQADQLIDPLKDALDNNELTIKNGAAIGKLSQESQEEIHSLMKDGHFASQEELSVFAKEKQELEKKLELKEKELNQKTKEIESLRNSNISSNQSDNKDLEVIKEKDDEIEKKNAAIKKLENEIKELKKPAVVDNMKSVDMEIFKAELSVKTYYEQSRASLQKYAREVELYLSKLNEDTSEEKILPDYEQLRLQKSNLLELIRLVENMENKGEKQ